MICKNCGKLIEDGTKYCGYCGADILEISDNCIQNETINSDSEAEEKEMLRTDFLRRIAVREDGRHSLKKAFITCFAIATALLFTSFFVRNGAWVFIVFVVISAGVGGYFLFLYHRANSEIESIKNELRKLE